MSNPNQDHTQVTQNYYDSDDADRFYHTIWGGEDIHVGIYEEGDSISAASRRSVMTMAKMAEPITAETKVLDVGAGYGGAARYLASTYGCHVVCLNLSTVENTRNIQKNKEVGLHSLIDVVDGNFEHLPFPDRVFDLIWSEDAILHSGAKEKVFEECHRVLKTGCKMIFTDPMQADDCPDGVLEPVLKRIHLGEMGSVQKYRYFANKQGWSSFQALEMPEQLVNHYSSVLKELHANEAKLKEQVSSEYVERMKSGLQHWIQAGNKGYLSWGIMVMEA